MLKFPSKFSVNVSRLEVVQNIYFMLKSLNMDQCIEDVIPDSDCLVDPEQHNQSFNSSQNDTCLLITLKY